MHQTSSQKGKMTHTGTPKAFHKNTLPTRKEHIQCSVDTDRNHLKDSRICKEQPCDPRCEQHRPEVLVPYVSLLLDCARLNEPPHPNTHAAKEECPFSETQCMPGVPLHVEAGAERGGVRAPKLVRAVNRQNSTSDRWATRREVSE